MPTRTPQDRRLSTALLLLGMVGLVASGLGLFPAVPAWVWLAVLVLGWCRPLLDRRAGARRFDRAELRRNEKARRNLRIARRRFARESRRQERRVDGLEARVAAGLSAEEVATLREAIVNFANDLQLMKNHLAVLLREHQARGLGKTFGSEDGG